MTRLRMDDAVTLHHTAPHCNTLQHTATHCNALQRTATHCNTLQKESANGRCGDVVPHVCIFQKEEAHIFGRGTHFWKMHIF